MNFWKASIMGMPFPFVKLFWQGYISFKEAVFYSVPFWSLKTYERNQYRISQHRSAHLPHEPSGKKNHWNAFFFFLCRGGSRAGGNERKECVDSVAGYLWVLTQSAFSLKASVSIKLAKENVWNILINTVHIRDGSSDLETIKPALACVL